MANCSRQKQTVTNNSPCALAPCILVLAVVFAPAWVGAAPAAHPPGAAVASAHPLATEAGLKVLAEGGNAFDAAVAVSAALSVVEPYSSGLGGGGFWLLHHGASGKNVMLDGRERAPLAAGRNMYLNKSGHYVRHRSRDGPLAAGIPGEPAALVHLAKHDGELSLKRDLAPAIHLARAGFKVDRRLAKLSRWRSDILKKYPAARAIFLPGGHPPDQGSLLKQPALAKTLTKMANQGRAGFYRGSVAKALVSGVRKNGGIWQLKDLARYRVMTRSPIVTHYRDYKLVSASPPSSGGIVLGEMLNILSGYPLPKLSRAGRDHLEIEAMRRAYRDRAAYLGDPDFVQMPVKKLLSPYYAAGLRAGIRMDKASRSDDLAPVARKAGRGKHTTHFSIIDRHGNFVAATLSVNLPYGSGYMAPGTGVILNDEMDDFSAKPLTPNVYGLVGTEANAIAPGKRPLSSMSPTFVVGPKRTAILGTPGGSRIITMVLLGALDFIHGGSAKHMVSLRRFHNQYLPDHTLYESGAFSPHEKQVLRAKGHRLKKSDRLYGNMQVVMWNRATHSLQAASDPRGIGAARLAHR